MVANNPDKAPHDPVLARLATMPLPVRFVYSRPRTFIAMAVGLVVGLLLPASLRPITRALMGWDVFIGLYVVLVFGMMLRSGHQDIHRNAARQDDGRFLILVFTALGAFASIAAILFELGAAHRGGPELTLATVTIALSWVAVRRMILSVMPTSETCAVMPMMNEKYTKSQ